MTAVSGTLDALAEKFPSGTRVRYTLDYRTHTRTSLGTVLGVAWSLPERPGDPREPWLIIEREDGLPGCIYVREVVAP